MHVYAEHRLRLLVGTVAMAVAVTVTVALVDEAATAAAAVAEGLEVRVAGLRCDPIAAVVVAAAGVPPVASTAAAPAAVAVAAIAASHVRPARHSSWRWFCRRSIGWIP